MKIVIAGGSGYLGTVLSKFYEPLAREIIILSRSAERTDGKIKTLHWDGKTIGAWMHSLEYADILINLTGKSVNCRYHEANKKEIINSRVDSVRVLGKALRNLSHPPALWIQSSSATIYKHSEDKLMTETDGDIGDNFSEQVCIAWEKVFEEQNLPRIRKVILRTSIVLGKTDGALPRLINLVRSGFGGKQGSGQQFMSWIHERDVARVIEWIRLHPMAQGTFNCTAPQPVTNATFMTTLRNILRVPIGLPISRMWLAFGAWLIGTETELILKSRKVYPQRLLDEGFVFEFPDLKSALRKACLVEKATIN